jgi:hypothetical protein
MPLVPLAFRECIFIAWVGIWCTEMGEGVNTYWNWKRGIQQITRLSGGVPEGTEGLRWCFLTDRTSATLKRNSDDPLKCQENRDINSLRHPVDLEGLRQSSLVTNMILGI